jgi:hypothetical protein
MAFAIARVSVASAARVGAPRPKSVRPVALPARIR